MDAKEAKEAHLASSIGLCEDLRCFSRFSKEDQKTWANEPSSSLNLSIKDLRDLGFSPPIAAAIRSELSSTSGPFAYVPFNIFTSLLPKRYSLDEETTYVLKGRYASALLGVASEQDAIQLFERAAKHPHLSTIMRLETECKIIVDGQFGAGASSAELSRGFSMESGEPLILKFSADAQREIRAFKTLELDWKQAADAHIVPLRLEIDCQSRREILVMPSFHCSLDSMPHAPAPVVLRGIQQIAGALLKFHNKKVYHMDVKPGNILIDAEGGWHLTDYDSCVWGGTKHKSKLTANFIPSDLSRRPSQLFDNTLLAVTAVYMLDPKALTLGSFSLKQLRASITTIKLQKLRQLLRTLLEPVHMKLDAVKVHRPQSAEPPAAAATAAPVAAGLSATGERSS